MRVHFSAALPVLLNRAGNWVRRAGRSFTGFSSMECCTYADLMMRHPGKKRRCLSWKIISLIKSISDLCRKRDIPFSLLSLPLSGVLFRNLSPLPYMYWQPEDIRGFQCMILQIDD